MCVVDVKYCNHLLAVDMAGVACRGLWCACGWKNVKGWESVKILWCCSFLPCKMFGCFLEIPSL